MAECGIRLLGSMTEPGSGSDTAAQSQLENLLEGFQESRRDGFPLPASCHSPGPSLEVSQLNNNQS